MYKKILILTTIVMALSSFTFAKDYSKENQSSLQGYAHYIPSGISTSAVLSDEINSQSAVIGQTINAVLIDDFKHEEKIIATKDSVIQGSIVANKKATAENKNSEMQIRFTTIRTPYNNIIPISALIKTQNCDGILQDKKIIVPANSKIEIYFDQPITLGAQ